MARYITDRQFREMVRVCLDENMSSEALETLKDVDTLSLNDIIDSKAEDSALSVLRAAPVDKLGDISQFLEGALSIAEEEPHKGIIQLPVDFGRLVRFKMASWKHALFDAMSPTTPIYSQANSEFGVLGTKDRPLIFLTPSTKNGKDLCLEIFSAKNTDDVLDGCLYVSMPKKEAIASDSSDSGTSGDSGSGSGDSGGSGGGGSDEPVAVSVTGITLNKTTLNLVVGDEEALTAEVTPSNATNKAVTWSSDNEAVATVEGGTVTGNGEGTCTVTCTAADGSEESDECEVTVTEAPIIVDGREYVDLDLPSKTLWATCNVGASSPEGYGDYFAWGETEPKEEYSWGNYAHGTAASSPSMTKYNANDNKTALDEVDDAAAYNWGTNSVMPTHAQLKELKDVSYTKTEMIEVNGVNCLRITSKINGKSILLPAAGDNIKTSTGGGQSSDTGECGYYWSRTCGSTAKYLAFRLYFDDNQIGTNTSGRAIGSTIRPVCKYKRDEIALPRGRKKVRINNGESSSTTDTSTGSNASWQILLGEQLLKPTIYYAAHLTALAIKDADAAAALLNTAKELLES